MLHDLRLVLRQLWKAKGFTATAVATLALGIGASTGIFTLLNAVLLKSLPVADPARLVRVGDGDNCCVLGGYQGRFSIYSYPLYTYFRDQTPEFEDLCAFQAGVDKVGVRRAGENTPAAFVDQFISGNYFRVFGLRAFAGRLIEPADDSRSGEPVAVMSYRAWREHYGGDPAIVGAQFVIEGAPFRIVGIAPPEFFGAELRPDPPDFWMPLGAEPATRAKNSLLDQASSHWLDVIGRVRPGASQAGVEAKVNAELQQWLAANQPPSSAREREAAAKQHITLAPGGGGVAGMKEQYDRDLRLLLGITGLVLLIACANLANLQLARGAALFAETSIRVALGAPRYRVVRLALTESVVLAVLGGAAGLLLASETARLLVRLAFYGAAYVPIDTAPSLAVLGFAFLLSLLTGTVCGAAPAWSASRADPAAALHGAGRSGTGGSTAAQKLLVVLQAALSLVLLTGAGLMVETMRNLTNQQFGFRMEGRMVVNVDAGLRGYSPEKLAEIYREIERQMQQIPGVRNAALTLYSPLSGNNWQSGATIEGRPNARVNPSWDRVSPAFFDTVGARILRGRGFNERDTPTSVHVAVVNQAFVEAYLPNEDPIGRRFGLGGIEHGADYTIVGVVNTIRFRDPRAPGRPMFFLPLLQMWDREWTNSGLARSNVIQSIELRLSGAAPPDLAARVQRALGSVDPNLTMLGMFSSAEMLDGLMAHEQLIGVLAEVFGVLALILASVGLYGLTAYSAARRTAEIGVRTALGATRGRVVRLILKSALAQAGAGIALGIPAALACGRLLSTQLFGVKAADPGIFAVAAAVLGVSSLLAGVIPAVRASGVDPVKALRVDR